MLFSTIYQQLVNCSLNPQRFHLKISENKKELTYQFDKGIEDISIYVGDEEFIKNKILIEVRKQSIKNIEEEIDLQTDKIFYEEILSLFKSNKMNKDDQSIVTEDVILEILRSHISVDIIKFDRLIEKIFENEYGFLTIRKDRKFSLKDLNQAVEVFLHMMKITPRRLETAKERLEDLLQMEGKEENHLLGKENYTFKNNVLTINTTTFNSEEDKIIFIKGEEGSYFSNRAYKLDNSGDLEESNLPNSLQGF